MSSGLTAGLLPAHDAPNRSIADMICIDGFMIILLACAPVAHRSA